MPVFMALLLQYESFHTFFSVPDSMGRRFCNFIRGKIPKVDVVRDALALLAANEVEGIFNSVVKKHIRTLCCVPIQLVDTWQQPLTERNCSAVQRNPAGTA